MFLQTLQARKLQKRGVFRTLLNICSGAFCENSKWLSAVNYFCKMLHLRCLTGFWTHLSRNGFFFSGAESGLDCTWETIRDFVVSSRAGSWKLTISKTIIFFRVEFFWAIKFCHSDFISLISFSVTTSS